jgi:hypothetical protein
MPKSRKGEEPKKDKVTTRASRLAKKKKSGRPRAIRMPTLTAATWSYGTALTLLTTLLMKSRGILATSWDQI